MTVAGVRAQTIKIVTGKKAKSTTELLLQFSGGQCRRPQNLGIYHLLQATRHKKGGAKCDKPVALASVRLCFSLVRCTPISVWRWFGGI